jgi:hypothetical protein
MERCPYLGLHDDSSTSLAYPSAWNYCYRAAPPASVLVSHQSETCLCPGYSDCTVYRSSKWERLPSGLRGSVRAKLGENRTSRARRWIAISLFVLLFALLVVFLSRRFDFTIPENRGSWISALSIRPAATEPLYSDPFVAAGDTTPAITIPSGSVTGLPGPIASKGATPLRAIPTPSQSFAGLVEPAVTASLALAQTRTPTSEGTCGHALDTAFGTDLKFVVHRVATGENLTLYAQQYETSTNAILAVNHHLPMPVWEDWIIVIPVEMLDVSDVPPFEPYQAIGTSLSLAELAKQLNTDPQALDKYNAFEGACKTFSGWLLVPRPPIDS